MAAAGTRVPVIVLPEEHSRTGTEFNLKLIPYFNEVINGSFNRGQILNFSEGPKVNKFFEELHKGQPSGGPIPLSMVEQKESHPDIATFKLLKMTLAILNIITRELDIFRAAKLRNPAYIFPQIDGSPAVEGYMEVLMLYLYELNTIFPANILSRVNTAWIDVFRGGKRNENYDTSIALLLEDLATFYATQDNTIIDFRRMIGELQEASQTATPIESRKTVLIRYTRLIRGAIDVRNIRKIEAFIQTRNADPNPAKHVRLVIMNVGLNHYENLSNLITASPILVRETPITRLIESIYKAANVPLSSRERARKTRSRRHRKKTRKNK